MLTIKTHHIQISFENRHMTCEECFSYTKIDLMDGILNIVSDQLDYGNG